MWKTIIVQISSKAFTYRNLVLQILLLQGIHRLVHESLLLFQVCMKFVISNHPVYQLVSLLTPIRNQQLLTAFKFFRKQFFPRGFVREGSLGSIAVVEVGGQKYQEQEWESDQDAYVYIYNICQIGYICISKKVNLYLICIEYQKK